MKYTSAAVCEMRNIPNAPYSPMVTPNDTDIQYRQEVLVTCNVPGGSVVTKKPQCLYEKESKVYKLLKESFICPGNILL